MKRKVSFLILLMICFLLLGRGGLQAEQQISGLMFGDYYYVLQHHDQAIKKQNGFWLRRIYFTYDNQLSDLFKIRFRLEMNSPGDFKTSSIITPYVKDAYLGCKLGKQSLFLGLIPTPLYDNVEDFWGYRSLEKTPMDLYKFGNSRDFGLGLRGTLDANKRLSYALIVGNGSGLKPEVDRGKAFYARLAYQPIDSLYFELYGDYSKLPDSAYVNIFQGFAGVKRKWGRAGLNYGLRRSRQDNVSSNIEFLSLFGILKVGAKFDAIVRYDRMLDPNPNGSKTEYIPFDNQAESNLLLAGLGWTISPNVQLIPSIKYVFYDTPTTGSKSGNDVYAHLTLFFKF